MKKQFLLLCIFFINKCVCDDPSSCQLYLTIDQDGIWKSNVYISDEIIDDDGVLNKQFPLTGKGSVVVYYSFSKYVDVVIENNYLIFRTNSNFSNFDVDTPKQTSNFAFIKANVQLRCGGSSALTALSFVQIVKDKNNHAPKFNHPELYFNMYTPLVPKIDLTGYNGGDVIVTDLDFSNQDVTFTLDSTAGDYWEFETVSTCDPKAYRAILRVTQITHRNGSHTFTLTATDSGTPPLSSTIQMSITTSDVCLTAVPVSSASSNLLSSDEKITRKNEYKVALVPSFSKTYYTATYTPSTKTDVMDSVKLNEDITVSENASISLQSDDGLADYFTISYTNTWVLSVSKNLDKSTLQDNKAIVLTLRASVEGAENGFSLLIIYLP